MLICLYVLPKTMSRYAITTSSNYYLNNCVSNTAGLLSVPIGNGTYFNGTADATWWAYAMHWMEVLCVKDQDYLQQ